MVLAEARHGHVAPDTGRTVQHERVRDLADGLVELSCGEPLQKIQGAWSTHLGLLQGGHVIEGYALAGGQGFGGDDLRPVPSGPLLAVRNLTPVEQRLVGLEPLRPLPTGGLEEVGPERLLARVEGAGAQGARLLHRLLGVDDVVDFPERLRAAGQDVRRAQGIGLEAVDISAADVYARYTVGDPLGHHPPYADGVG